MGKNTSYGALSQEWLEYIAKTPIANFESLMALPAEEARHLVLQNDLKHMPPMDGVTIEKRQIRTSDGAEIEVQVFIPSTKPSGDAPLVLAVHGGGWYYGTVEMESTMIKALVEDCGAVVVAPNYRLAPEHPFPIPVNDSYDALLWALENAESLGADANKFFVGGSSAGGNISAALCLKAKAEGIHNKIRGQILIYPATCDYRHYPSDRFELESYSQLQDPPVLDSGTLANFWQMYNPTGSADPLCSPLLAEDPSGLPPAYIQAAGADLLRDEGIAYAEHLKAAGVPVRLDIFPGLPHGFSAAFLSMQSAQKSNEGVVKNVKWMLDGAEGPSETHVV